MKWFMNMKIAAKLSTGFIIVSLLTAVVGVIGIVNIKAIAKSDVELYENVTVPISELADMSIEFQRLRVNFRDILLTDDPLVVKSNLDQIAQRQTIMAKDLESINKTITSVRMRELFDDLVKKNAESQQSVDRVYELAEKGEVAGIPALMSATGAAGITTKALEGAIDNMIKVQIEDAKLKSDDNTAIVNRATVIMVIVILAGVLIAIGLGMYLSSIISKPLKFLAETADKLAVGDIDVDVNVKRKAKDEIGTLLGSFEKMVENVRDQVDATEKMADGNLSVTVKVKSDKDLLGKKLVEMQDTMKVLLDETDKLVVATQEGKLDTRGNAKAFVGSWGTLVGGINNLIDTLVGHIDSMPSPVMIIDKDFNIVYMNKTGANLLSATQKQLVGNKCYDVYKTSDCKTANCACAMSMQQGQKVSRETDAHPNGMNLDILCTAIPLKDKKNQVIGAMELVVDQTAIMNAARVAEKQAKYQEKETSKLLVNIENLAQGKLHCSSKIEPTDVDTKAIGEMFTNIYKSFEESLNAMSAYVKETAKVLTEMSMGNLDLSITDDYKGDFAEIKSSVNLIIDSFNEVLSNMNNASVQVAAGARQVSDSAQALSQGSTEQASSIEELTASMEEISTQTKLNAANANQANELALAAKEGAIKGNEQMQGMLKAMADINEASGNIYKIIKVIDEIAFQTNILALNAAVEAARAGQHGKGFAVVAEEVRNLAARSANAAKETTALIEGSINKVEGGTKIANDTAAALNQIVEDVSKTTNLVGEIATASNEQALGINQVNQGILQVSDVVQTNSATSEESAAASEELSSQAELLREQVSRFKLKKTTGSAYRGLEHMNPDVLRMLENMSQKKQENSSKNRGNAEAAKTSSKSRIALSDQEFGKY
ncbi:methyl-accepting chemotaxis protein [Desulfosporosinus youngiae]|uniref:Methyl-accepting chemotaxis protein n=1 Tax=Desulfosporosinus youngiae DSM 17734 TaxID=768710 RepID=H5Y5T0_9FIRM|nr:methyl-accepting chemotaxis protein [Desulfosporosinus youngiae]EHQ90806.1 methyl-accepting chemotaxis protein [Desulfosporosinus youngiae DSM 17734]